MILKDFNDFKGLLWILTNFKIIIFQKTLFSPKKDPCGKMHTRQNISWLFSRIKKTLRENPDTTKKCVAHVCSPFLVSGTGILIFHKFSQLTTKYFMRKTMFFINIFFYFIFHFSMFHFCLRERIFFCLTNFHISEPNIS